MEENQKRAEELVQGNERFQAFQEEVKLKIAREKESGHIPENVSTHWIVDGKGNPVDVKVYDKTGKLVYVENIETYAELRGEKKGTRSGGPMVDFDTSTPPDDPEKGANIL